MLETTSTLVVDHCTSNVAGAGSNPSTATLRVGRMLHKKKKIFSIFSQLIMKVLKILGYPRRRGVPAKPPPSPLQTPPLPPPPLLILPWVHPPPNRRPTFAD